MNTRTHSDYKNHIVFRSTDTKIDTQLEKAPIAAQTEVNLLIWL